MRTANEIDRDGTPLRVFHRRGNSAWTHPIGEPSSEDRCGCRGESVEPHPGSALLATLVNDAASVIAPLAAERKLELRVDAPEEPVTLETDVTKVRHILVNLLSNAVKFTERGEVVLTVCIENEQVRFDVTDTGVGIAPQFHERIFDPFWQVENQASRRVAGTGIGLSVARRLARLLGGDITVTSKPDSGSTFTARVPRRLGEAGARA